MDYGKNFLLSVIIFLSLTLNAWAIRIKDIAQFEGVRRNKLIGYGLVIGLNGTGDDGKNAKFTVQSLANMLEKMGVTVNPKDIEKVENVAAVMVTADLPPFARVGSRIDALVSSIGDAESLEGGILLLTPLRAADGKVYAVAQGPISIGGFFAGGMGAAVQKNFPTVGRVVSGALVEREMEGNFNDRNLLSLALRNYDFTTAKRVAQVINIALGGNFAEPMDGGTVGIEVPTEYQKKVVDLVSLIEGLEVAPDIPARVVINERTGTVVMGENVRISTVAIAHGNLSIEIKEKPKVSQPLPFSAGETVVTPDTEIVVKEERSPLFLVKSGINIGEVVRALNALGVTPRDLIAILQALKAAGALQAKLEII
ncbi:MAG: flagellar biosynthesis protein FlgA [Deltaproteobacteria bacterium]|nr:MAG: flagellar biosynthesis protein FlgA [Deltaproteobacteria bacterium]